MPIDLCPLVAGARRRPSIRLIFGEPVLYGLAPSSLLFHVLKERFFVYVVEQVELLYGNVSGL